MNHPLGYRIEQELYASAGSVVFRAHRASDGAAVVIKQLRDEYPRREATESLRREFATLQRLAIPEVAQALALEPVGSGLALVLEDSGASPAEALAPGGRLEPLELLRLAIEVTRAVGAVHEKGIIHKDLKPSHMLRDTRGVVRLIDFGISTQLAEERSQLVDPDLLEGTLAYISPEQTGRMNRPVDRRSDLYSLGVSFFELATGQLPFPTVDPLELVHCHIARTPPRADAVRPDIPAMVAAIIEKLLAKVAEDRYQTAAGLLVDLQRCEAELSASGRVEPFALGAGDLSDVLLIPQRLYGREAALGILHAAFEQVRGGRTHVLLLSGPSGIGKSALVHQLRKELVLKGHFVSGKFDQLRGSAPYPALSEACRALVRAVLREPRAALAARKEALLAALGRNARLVIDVVPELELIIGPQERPAPLGSAEAQNRFEQAFEGFFGALVRPDEPLVIFLDDLQWADAASLRLLRRLITAPGHRPLLVLGAYRENEVSGVHPLLLELAELEKSTGQALSTLRIQPLRQEDVTSLAAEALSRPPAEVQPLAAVLFEKTRGNPFHLGQFLHALFRDGMLRADVGARQWRWDLPAIATRRVTDNVVELVLERLRTLPAEAQEVLSLGACIGHEFDSDTVASVTRSGRAGVARGLEAALREGMLLPLDENHRYLSTSGADARGALNARFRFLHDRVQQAAYALIDARERDLLHLRIGRHLRGALGPAPTDGQLFAVAEQLNRGLGRLEAVEERAWLAELDLSCAAKAQATGATAVALELLARALELLGPDAWTDHPALACAAHLARAEGEYLSGRPAEAFASLDAVDEHATEVLDRVAAGNLRASVLTSLGRLSEACLASVATARVLGVELPDPTASAALGQAIGAEFGALATELAGRPDAALRELPEMTDPLALARLATFARAIPAAYQSNGQLMVLCVLKAMRLSLERGVADLTPFFFAQYAIAHLVITKDHVAAHRFGRLGVELGLARRNLPAVGPAHFIFAAFVAHWCEPIAVSLEHFELGLRRSLELGDLMYAAYCVGLGALYRIHAGSPLGELRAELPRALEMVQRMGEVLNQSALALCGRFLATMAGESERFGHLDGVGFDEVRFEAQATAPERSWLRSLQAMLRYLAGEYSASVAAADGGEPFVGMVMQIDLRFFSALSHAALARRAEGQERAAHLGRLGETLEVFERWAELCPANQAHRLALLLAERADLSGDLAGAMTHYEAAIEGARRQGFLQHHALACELTGEFHLRAGRTRAARGYLTDAVRAYDSWGASAKARALRLAHEALELGVVGAGGRPPTATTARGPGTSTLGQSAAWALDLESAMRATQAIARELESDKLLESLLRIVVENAGAQRGALVLPSDGHLYLEAERTVEPDEVTLRLHRPVSRTSALPVEMVRYVARTHEPVVSGNAVADEAWRTDDYVRAHGPKSVLCVALMHQGQLSAVLYLENRAAPHVFSPARVERIQFLAAHAASALENSRLYEEVQLARQRLEARVQERTVELSQRNSDLRGVFDAVSQGLVTIDDEGRVVGDVSAQAVAWFGPIAERCDWVEVLARADAEGAQAFRALFAEVRAGAEGQPSGSARMARRLTVGRRRLSLELRPVAGVRGRERVLVVVSDVTDEERQRQLEVELRHSQKLESVGQLAAGIAHEINTPAQFVGDSLSFLAESFGEMQAMLTRYRRALAELGDPGPAVLEAVKGALAQAEVDADLGFAEENAPASFERAQEGVSRIATLVSAMKEFAHPARREKSLADLNRALRNTITIARNEYKDVAELETELGELPEVMCHVSDMNQVFLNLLVNAAHAVREVVGRGSTKGRIRVRTARVDASVRIDVEDTGCGIAPGIRDRVFDPFFTTKEVGRGSGQGLAIARSIVVDKHGGTLTFESAVGEGTTFTVVLPIDGGGGR